MVEFLRGNYEISENPGSALPDKPMEDSLTERFEQSVLAKLGGSVCFVVKNKTLLWTGENLEETG